MLNTGMMRRPLVKPTRAARAKLSLPVDFFPSTIDAPAPGDAVGALQCSISDSDQSSEHTVAIAPK